MNSYASISQLLCLSYIGNEAADRRNIESAIEALKARLATVEAERDAARAGEARAVEACQRIEEALQGTDFADHGLDSPVWNALELVRDVTADEPALDWLAQQRREAVEAERIANTNVIRSLGPEFCDFVFGNLGEAEYLAGVLAGVRRQAAAEELESFADDAGGMEELMRCNVADLDAVLRKRAAALRAGEVTE